MGKARKNYWERNGRTIGKVGKTIEKGKEILVGDKRILGKERKDY